MIKPRGEINILYQCPAAWRGMGPHKFETVYDEVPNTLLERIKSFENVPRDFFVLKKVNKTYCTRCGFVLSNSNSNALDVGDEE